MKFASWRKCANIENRICECKGLAAYGRGCSSCDDYQWTFASSSSSIKCGHRGIFKFGRNPSNGTHYKLCYCASLKCRNRYPGDCDESSSNPHCNCNKPTPNSRPTRPTPRPTRPTPRPTRNPVAPSQNDVDCSNMSCDLENFLNVTSCDCKNICCVEDQNGGGGGGSSCFSAKGMVNTLKHGLITLDALQVGDLVEDYLNSYTKVVGFLHRDTSTVMTFLKLESNTSSIVVSHDHLLAIDGGFIKARNVDIGMKLSTSVHGTGSLEIVHVQEVTVAGFYAPLTESGVLAVNGFLVSCYANIPAELHWLANILMYPRKKFMSYGVLIEGVDVYAGILRAIFFLPCLLLDAC